MYVNNENVKIIKKYKNFNINNHTLDVAKIKIQQKIKHNFLKCGIYLEKKDLVDFINSFFIDNISESTITETNIKNACKKINYVFFKQPKLVPVKSTRYIIKKYY